MKYTLMKAQSTEIYERKMLEAIETNHFSDLLLGIEKDFTIIDKSSYLYTMSDPWVIFNYCAYPLFVKGTTGIKKLIEETLYEFIDDVNIIGIYQAARFVDTQNYLKFEFEDLPFEIDTETISTRVRQVLFERKSKIQSFDASKYQLANLDILIENNLAKY